MSEHLKDINLFEFSVKFEELQDRYCEVNHFARMQYGSHGDEARQQAESLYNEMVDLTAGNLLHSGGGEKAQGIVDKMCELKMWKTGTAKWNVHHENFLERVIVKMSDMVGQENERI